MNSVEVVQASMEVMMVAVLAVGSVKMVVVGVVVDSVEVMIFSVEGSL